MSEHNVTIQQVLTPTIYRNHIAVCSCGWAGPERTVKTDALIDGGHHVNSNPSWRERRRMQRAERRLRRLDAVVESMRPKGTRPEDYGPGGKLRPEYRW
jgi:hypothetical protein